MTGNWPAAPYIVGGAISDSQFSGRTDLLRRLVDLVGRPKHPGFRLLGARRTGKSSILERFERLLNNPKVFLVRIDLFGVLGHSEHERWKRGAVATAVLHAVMDAMEAQIGTAVPESARRLAASPFDPTSFRKDALPALLRWIGPRRLIVLLDEMEVAHLLDPESPSEIAAAFQPWLDLAPERPLLGVVWGRPFGTGTMFTVPAAYKGFALEHVDRLTRTEADAALLEPVAAYYKWAEDALDVVWDQSRGHPLFLASLGAAVHGNRSVGDARAVTSEEVMRAIDEAVARADTWYDAWAQLSTRSQLLLRVVAGTDEPWATMEDVTRKAFTLGSPFQVGDFLVDVHGLVEDWLLESGDLGVRIAIPLIRQWICRINPAEIVGVAATPRSASAENTSTGVHAPLGASTRALQSEEEGRIAYEAGNLGMASRAFRAALQLDASRWTAAVLLGRIHLQLNDPVPAAELLRAAKPVGELRRVRAQLLARCISQTLDQHGDPSEWIAELATIDPRFEEVPEAAALVEGRYVEGWLDALQYSDIASAKELTDRRIIARGRSAVTLALRMSREIIARSSDHGTHQELRGLLYGALPHLLRETESIAIEKESYGAADPAAISDLQDEWRRAFRALSQALASIAYTDVEAITGEDSARALRILVECEAFRTRLGDPLRSLISALITADAIGNGALTSVEATRRIVLLLPGLTEADAILKLQQAIEKTALEASIGPEQQMVIASETVPTLALALVRIVRSRPDVAFEVHVQPLIEAAGLLVERLRADPAAPVHMHGAIVAQWKLFLSAIQMAGETTGLKEFAKAVDELPEAKDTVEITPSNATAALVWKPMDRGVLVEMLGKPWVVANEPIAYRIDGVPAGYIRAWSVERFGKQMLARVYRVGAGDESVLQFLRQLWDNERRLLDTLSTRWEGRALPRLHVARFDSANAILVLVTDAIGGVTLRDSLRGGEVARLRIMSRPSLWRHLSGIIEALAALHNGGYLHRALKPENILASSRNPGLAKTTWLQLANFEWSVYLYALAESEVVKGRPIDRYCAPERFADLENLTGPSGEGPATDTFALGLVLFECIISPLTPEELVPLGRSHGRKQQTAWVNELLKQVRRAETDNSITASEAELLGSLLQPNPMNRPADLREIVKTVGRLILENDVSKETVDTVPLVTALEIGTKESIARFIKEENSEYDFATIEKLRSWIEDQLEGAEIMPNRQAGAPLFLAGKAINFTVEPFVYRDATYEHIGWLKIAKKYDGPAGGSIGRIAKARVENLTRTLALESLLTMAGGWTPWFHAVERMHDGLSRAERAFVNRVRWSVELERKSWSRQVFPYKRVGYKAGERPGDKDILEITDHSREHGDRYGIADLMAQAVDRENIWFEVGPVRDPVAAFHDDRRWIQTKSGEDSDVVRLERFHRDTAEEPPESGFVRPYSLAGHSVLYKRHMHVLDELQRDPYLVRSVLTPAEVFDDLNLARKASRGRLNLDDDKVAIAAAVQNRKPLFLVQGPPGTGKTTLAAEVILRTLQDDPAARILVVSQAHDPLNNLLQRVEDALDNWVRETKATRRPTCVRLVAEERLNVQRYGVASTDVPRRYNPARFAAQILDKAAQWTPTAEKGITHQKALHAYQRLLAAQQLQGLSRSLERRLVASANIVYATANDRRLAAMGGGNFDLVIYEETAKALPIEVLSPLRFARRWLLIGDQKQLPPFGLDDIERTLFEEIEELRKSGAYRRPAAGDPFGVDPRQILGPGEVSRDEWADATQSMLRMLRFFGDLYNRARRVPVTGAPAQDEVSARVVEGLTGMLTTQWRMHPVIGSLVSNSFYEGKVKNGDPEKLAQIRGHRLLEPNFLVQTPIVWLDVPHVDVEPLASEVPGFGGGWENDFEVRAIMGFLKKLYTENVTNLELAILSPYRAQVRVFERIARGYEIPGIPDLALHVQTADSFQGRQADIVALSLVRNSKVPLDAESFGERMTQRALGFLASAQRATVAFSRAERLLIVTGCLAHFRRFPNTAIGAVAREIDELSGTARSGVVVVPATDFLDDRHWKGLRDYRDRKRSSESRRKADSPQVTGAPP